MAEQKQTKALKEEKQASERSTGKIVVVRVRGRIRLLTVIKNTLDMMRLYKTNYCVVLDNTSVNRGMIQKAKDYVTWGEADNSIIDELFAKRGTLYTGQLTDSKKKIDYKSRYVEYQGKKYSKFFKLNPPKQGYGRKGIKTTFTQGGGVGERADKINDLVRRMI